MCRSNNCSDRYNMDLSSLFDNPDEPINTLSPIMRIFVLCWNHHHIFLRLRMTYPLLRLHSPLWEGGCRFSGGQTLLKLEDLIWWSPAEVYYRKRRNSALEGVMEVTVRILDPDVMRFRHDPLVGIRIFYLAIKSQALNRCRAVKWLTVVQQPILKFNKYTVYEYILIISEHKSTNFMSPVVFTLFME